MTLSTDACLAAIAEHSTGFAAAVRDNLDARVEHCPEWDVADLVAHLTEVHWFWRTIAAERLTAPPEESRRPARADRSELVATFERGAAELVDVLGRADQDAPVWTWFPGRQDIGFITRHQVQEAAVHHWDAANAAGTTWTVRPEVAADAVEEFLSCSLADADDVARLDRSLSGPLVLTATDIDRSWTVSQTDPAAALTWTPGAHGAVTVSGAVADLLLWIYGRATLPTGLPDRVAEFRALSSTD
ncbi:maleylpyruvate isomerase family mycothiol-dependent enzyme [Actinopolymorpha singaporensis]|uniref:TIGR03083 family protein n=1 Tax=Actinopolymorpha singaporensis TaxID=117157 RepID=A0A1H1MJD0_9ACTN|nr:maleylpyruvate isomerase family mycothiol-dependent enzyme [Actinopolymorpha singaporensis]SDR86848.1 TIGR03083 family protein [Actinopolymorpha singaporensis]